MNKDPLTTDHTVDGELAVERRRRYVNGYANARYHRKHPKAPL